MLEREHEPIGALHDVVRRTHVGVRRRAERHDARPRVARHAGHARVVRVENGEAVGTQRAHEAGLLVTHAFDRPEKFRVHRGDDRHHSDGRCGEDREGRDLAGLVRAELDDERSVLGAEAKQGERQAPLVVEASCGLQRVPPRAQDGRDELLRRRLAVGARDGDDRDRELRAVPAGETAERLRRVLHEDERHVRGRIVRRQLVDDEACGAAARGFREVRVAVEAVALDRKERLADRRRARVDRDPGDGHGEVAADERALGRADEVLDGERRLPPRHACLPARSAARPRGRRTEGRRRRLADTSRDPFLRSPPYHPAVPTRGHREWRPRGRAQ